MTVLWSKCGDIVSTVVLVWCHCGGTVRSRAIVVTLSSLERMGPKVVAQW